jgi:hypothetical protein
MAWKLCSKEEVILIHPYPVADLKDFWSEVVETLIREHMGSPHLGQSTVITNETHSGDNTTILIVRKPPIISVEALRISATAMVSTGYVVFQNHIQLVAQRFPEGTLNVQVDYTSGDLTVSPTVKLTAAAMIAAMINYRERYGADSTMKWGSGDQESGETTPNLNVGLTSHLRTIMRRMLRRERIRAS